MILEGTPKIGDTKESSGKQVDRQRERQQQKTESSPEQRESDKKETQPNPKASLPIQQDVSAVVPVVPLVTTPPDKSRGLL